MDAMVEPHTADREIVIERIFDAPRELVWEAWTNPEHVAQWWGPDGFTTTIEKMEFRVGGVWKLVMHGPDGTDYPNSSMFREIVEPERIVFSHGGGREGGPGAHFLSTWTFEALGKQTRLTMRLVFATPADRDLVVREYGAIEGGKQTLARLAGYLPRMADRPEHLIISRIFDAPRELVWQAWTDPAHIMQWWGPQGFENKACEADLQLGGRFRLEMRAPNGNTYPCVGTYREIVEPERIVFDSDADDSHPCGAGLPPRSVVTVGFADLGDKTLLTLHTRFESVPRRDAANRAGYSTSWGQALERLAGHLY